MRFLDKRVWITGASSGIGEALARALRAEGARVALSARRRDELERVAADCAAGPGEAVAVPLDVADADSVAAAAAAVLARFGGLDVVVANAGVTHRSLAEETGLAVFRRVMEVNYFGALATTLAVLPSMLARGDGQVVAVTSVAAKYGSPMRSGYVAAKHAAQGFFEALREEVAGRGVDVTVIVPGPVRTGISVNALAGDGSRWGRMDRFIAQGLAPEACAARMLDAIAARRREVVISGPGPRRDLALRRLAPRLLSRRLRRAVPRPPGS